MILMKFGGTSMGTPASIQNNVASLIREAVRKKKAPFVVVSAMSGVTNALLQAAEFAIRRDTESMLIQLNAIHQKHIDAAKEMIKDPTIQKEVRSDVGRTMNELGTFLTAISTIGELSARSHDIIMAVGEKLSARLLTGVLGDQGQAAEYVNLEQVIKEGLTLLTNAYWDRAEEAFRKRLHKVPSGVVPVLTGFFGPTDQGILESVGRGYSDFCASLAGAAMKAKEIQIWTDVDGILSTNPTLVQSAFLLERVSFDEMAELSHFGARVLHPGSVRPALNAGIPIRILNTFNPQCPGTLITEEGQATALPFKSIAYKKGITLIRICSSRMLMAYGFMKKISDRFAAHRVSIDLIASSEVSVSVSVDEKTGKELNPLLKDLEDLGQVHTRSNQTVISIVGAEMQRDCHIQGRIFDTLNRKKIPVSMASMGLSFINLSLVVDDRDCDKAVQALHDEFFIS